MNLVFNEPPTPPRVPAAPKKARIKKIIILLLIVLTPSLATGAYFVFRKNTSLAPIKTVASVPGRIRLIAAGDFIAHDSVNSNALQTDGSYNYLPMMQDFVPVFKKADIGFCNDPILNGGNKFGISGYPIFNSPTEFVTDMGRLGCNLVNTASNHSFEKTQETINASVTAWDNVPNMLAVVGQNRNQTEHDTVHYFTVKGLKFAFLAYTTYINNGANLNNYGVNFYSQSFASSQITEAKRNGAQVIIVSMRWGTEYSSAVNDEQRKEAQFLSDQGASLILGHGPHVLETVEQLTSSNGGITMVWYSLGNFINTQVETETLFNGIAVIDFDTTSHKITAQYYLPIYMHYEWSAAQKAVTDLAARKNLRMYFLDDTTQAIIDSNQLKTSVAEQRNRISSLLNKNLKIPLITKTDYLTNN